MSETTEIRAGKYRHFKGGLYTVIGVATNSENLGKVVVYQDEASGKLWVRPASMWNDVINGKRRFELISNEQGEEMICSICEEIFNKGTNKDLIPICPKCKEKMKKWEEMKKDKIMRRTSKCHQ